MEGKRKSRLLPVTLKIARSGIIALRATVTGGVRLQCQVVTPPGYTDKNSILATRKRTMQRKENKMNTNDEACVYAYVSMC